MTSPSVTYKLIDKHILSLLRCGKKCICYQHYRNKHLQLTTSQIKEMYYSRFIQGHHDTWCFTNYDGTSQFERFRGGQLSSLPVEIPGQN